MKEAFFYSKEKGKVRCSACNRRCSIPESAAGYCRVRKNVGGKLYSLVYGKTLTLSVDPIEKKPLFHFKPGTMCNGVSTYGCNFSCRFCQNHHISQDFTEEMIASVPETTPEEIVEDTLDKEVEGIAYTYVEPTIFAEYALDTMKIAKEKSLYNVWVSNGYMSRELAEALLPCLDAINIDLKGNAAFYKKMCGNADIGRVKDNIRFFHEKGVHVEVTNLVVPGYNDSRSDFQGVAEFIASLSEEMPLHFSRFFPHYKMLDVQPTPLETLAAALEEGKKAGLKYVYAGNTPREHSTYCPKCGKLLVERSGFSAIVSGLDEQGKCVFCGFDTKIVR